MVAVAATSARQLFLEMTDLWRLGDILKASDENTLVFCRSCD
jgi:hypothetical protein